MQNAGLNEPQAGIKIAGRNIRNFRYADYTTLMAESKEELKYLLMKRSLFIHMRVKKTGLNSHSHESEKNWLKTQHSEN